MPKNQGFFGKNSSKCHSLTKFLTCMNAFTMVKSKIDMGYDLEI